MINSECFRIFEERLALKVKKQLGELDKNIEADKRLSASKGLLQSGAMINGVKRLCVNVLESRVDYIFEILSDLPFKYSSKIGVKISETSKHYFPSDLGELYHRLDDIIRLANGEHAREHVVNEVLNANNAEIERFQNLLNQFLLNLKTSRKFSAIDKIIFLMEAICLLSTAFLAGKWLSDPTRLYQPYIIVVGVIISSLEIIRRAVKRLSEN